MAKFVVVDLASRQVLGSVDSSHRMSTNEILEFIGCEIIKDMDDPRWSDDYDNVLFHGERFYYDELDVFQEVR